MSAFATARSLAPGLGIAAVAVLIARLVNAAVPTLSALVVALLIGVLLANLRGVSDSWRPGLTFSAKRLLRLGIVVLGLRLSLDEVAELGASGLLVVLVTVAVTFFGTQWMGRRLGLGADLSLLVATGYSICGASAIAAMSPNTEADTDEIAASIGLVTLFGTLSIPTLGALGGLMNLDDDTMGAWIGAAVHDVAQVVATAAGAGGAAVISAAVVVKLTRVVLLAPLVAGVGMGRRGRAGSGPILLPAFVIGFLAAVALRSSDLLGESVLSAARTLEGLLLAAAMFALGTGVDLARLRRLGPRPLVLGALSWVLVASVSLAGVLLIA